MSELEKAKERCDRIAAAISFSQDGGAIAEMQERLTEAQGDYAALSAFGVQGGEA